MHVGETNLHKRGRLRSEDKSIIASGTFQFYTVSKPPKRGGGWVAGWLYRGGGGGTVLRGRKKTTRARRGSGRVKTFQSNNFSSAVSTHRKVVKLS